jgi:hypothetical protein
MKQSLRNLVFKSLFSVFTLSAFALTAQAQSANTSVDFNAINVLIDEVIANSIQFDNTIKDVSLKFSPTSDLQTGKITAQFSAQVGTAPWSKNQDSQINLQLGSQFKDQNELSKEGTFKIKAVVKTSTLGMIRYLAEKDAARRSDRTDDSGSFEILVRLSKVADIHDLYLVALDIKKLLLTEAKDNDAKVFVQNLDFQTHELGGRVVSFEVVQTKPVVISFYDKIELRAGKIAIDENNFSFGLHVISNFSTKSYDEALGRLSKAFADLQSRKAQALKDIEGLVRSYAELVKDFLNS